MWNSDSVIADHGAVQTSEVDEDLSLCFDIKADCMHLSQ